jgi:hypothetical protein
MIVATMGHVSHTRLLIAPTTATDRMTSADRCYRGAHGTHVGATSAHNNDDPSHISGSFLLMSTIMTTRLTPSDISGLLLLPPTVVTGSMTSDDHCYCGARDMCAISTRPNSNDGPSDISGPLLLPNSSDRLHDIR